MNATQPTTYRGTVFIALRDRPISMTRVRKGDILWSPDPEGERNVYMRLTRDGAPEGNIAQSYRLYATIEEDIQAGLVPLTPDMLRRWEGTQNRARWSSSMVRGRDPRLLWPRSGGDMGDAPYMPLHSMANGVVSAWDHNFENHAEEFESITGERRGSRGWRYNEQWGAMRHGYLPEFADFVATWFIAADGTLQSQPLGTPEPVDPDRERGYRGRVFVAVRDNPYGMGQAFAGSLLWAPNDEADTDHIFVRIGPDGMAQDPTLYVYPHRHDAERLRALGLVEVTPDLLRAWEDRVGQATFASRDSDSGVGMIWPRDFPDEERGVAPYFPYLTNRNGYIGSWDPAHQYHDVEAIAAGRVHTQPRGWNLNDSFGRVSAHRLPDFARFANQWQQSQALGNPEPDDPAMVTPAAEEPFAIGDIVRVVSDRINDTDRVTTDRLVVCELDSPSRYGPIGAYREERGPHGFIHHFRPEHIVRIERPAPVGDGEVTLLPTGWLTVSSEVTEYGEPVTTVEDGYEVTRRPVTRTHNVERWLPEQAAVEVIEAAARRHAVDPQALLGHSIWREFDRREHQGVTYLRLSDFLPVRGDGSDPGHWSPTMRSVRSRTGYCWPGIRDAVRGLERWQGQPERPAMTYERVVMVSIPNQVTWTAAVGSMAVANPSQPLTGNVSTDIQRALEFARDSGVLPSNVTFRVS